MLTGCQFKVSDLFDIVDENDFASLEYVGFDFGDYPKSQVRKLFQKLPALICGSFKRMLYIKPKETFESVLNFEKHFEYLKKIQFLRFK